MGKKSNLVEGFGVNDVGDVSKFQMYKDLDGKVKYKMIYRCPFYRKWSNMLTRSNPQNSASVTRPDYAGNIVCKDWIYFSNFKAWANTQPYFDYGISLDKDLLYQGNKVYSPSTCVLIPPHVNSSIVLSNKSHDNNLPLGVSKARTKRKERYKAQGFRRSLGTYTEIKEAHKAWQIYKSDKMLKTALEYFSEPSYKLVISATLYEMVAGIQYDLIFGLETTELKRLDKEYVEILQVY